jgi:hypothetical protein
VWTAETGLCLYFDHVEVVADQDTQGARAVGCPEICGHCCSGLVDMVLSMSVCKFHCESGEVGGGRKGVGQRGGDVVKVQCVGARFYCLVAFTKKGAAPFKYCSWLTHWTIDIIEKLQLHTGL